MARIICPECGNDLNEEVLSCPHCGLKLQFGDLTCPKCSSKSVYAEKEMLDDIMAIADWVVTGGWDILSKAESKDINFICIKCGNRFKCRAGLKDDK